MRRVEVAGFREQGLGIRARARGLRLECHVSGAACQAQPRSTRAGFRRSRRRALQPSTCAAATKCGRCHDVTACEPWTWPGFRAPAQHGILFLRPRTSKSMQGSYSIALFAARRCSAAGQSSPQPSRVAIPWQLCISTLRGAATSAQAWVCGPRLSQPHHAQWPGQPHQGSAHAWADQWDCRDLARHMCLTVQP